MGAGCSRDSPPTEDGPADLSKEQNTKEKIPLRNDEGSDDETCSNPASTSAYTNTESHTGTVFSQSEANSSIIVKSVSTLQENHVEPVRGKSDGKGSTGVGKTVKDKKEAAVSQVLHGGGENPFDAQVAYMSTAGQEPGYTKTNQDNCFSQPVTSKSGNKSFFGVFDGHGPNGQLVTAFTKDNFPIFMSHQLETDTEISQALKNTFLQVDKELSKGRIDCEFSGCTAVAALLDGPSLHCAWVGDSRAVIGRKGNSGLLEAICLTKDHKPDDEAERNRIIRNKGRVDRLVDETGEQIGPYRIWLKYAWVPGLAMSRALGDTLAHRVGVTSEPEVYTHKLSKKDHYLILATDGLWEFISNDEAISIVSTCPTAESACEKLVVGARERWMREEDGVVDDITVICIFFSQPEKLK